MLKNFALVAFRDLVKHKTHTIINLVGLSVAVALCLLIVSFVQNELSYDEFHVNKERAYALVALEPQSDGTIRSYQNFPVPLGPAYQEAMPAVDAMSRWVRARVILRAGENVIDKSVAYVDSDFLAIFSFPILYGDSATALRELGGLVVSRSTATELFGRENVVGEQLSYTVAGETRSCFISAVTEDPPSNSTIQYTVLQRFDAYPWIDRYRDDWWSWRCLTYVLLAPQANPGDVESASESFLATTMPVDEDGSRPARDSSQILLQPIDDMHLNLAGRFDFYTNGEIGRSYVLGGIGVLVLLIACINYIILALGVTAGRSREVGLRKVMGAVPGQLMRQFIVEAVILALIAVTAGVAVSEVFLPTFNQLTGKELTSTFGAGWLVVIALLGLAAAIGLAAGAAPAFVMSRMRPVNALKGRFGLHGMAKVSWLLVSVQFALTIFLIFGAVTISRQMDHIAAADLGYDPHNLVVIPTHASEPGAGERTLDLLRNELKGAPGIEQLSGTAIAFTEGTSRTRWSLEHSHLWAYEYVVDHAYIDAMRMQILEGRNFDPARSQDQNTAVILNETAMKQYGLSSVGEVVPELSLETDGPPVRVIGVVKDHNFLSLHREMQPMLLQTMPSEWLQYIIIRVSPQDIPSTVTLIDSTWARLFPQLPYEANFMEDMLQTQYEAERRWQQVTLAASIIAVIIACMGLFGQVTLTIARRTKEIGIRKVLGASVTGVTLLLSKLLILRIALAGVVACGAAFYVMNRWLEQFPYRISLGFESILLSVGAALVVALLTVGVRTIRAARANPVDSLRYE